MIFIISLQNILINLLDFLMNFLLKHITHCFIFHKFLFLLSLCYNPFQQKIINAVYCVVLIP